MSATIIPRGPDGYYHPKDEKELQALVAYAYANAIQLRVRGSSHSLSPAIYTDSYDGEGVPPGDAMDLMLDRYREVTITPETGNPGHAIVAIEAGCNLGKNPYDPTHTSTWLNSLNYKLQRAGYAVPDLGGISHQTISGFTATGSSGGSVMYTFYDALVRIRFIDGTGQIHEVARDDADPEKRELFFAAGVSLGLLGVISKVWIRVGPSYNLFGSQVTTSTAESPIDLFGPGTDKKPSLERFLRETPYTRLMWWPQHDFDRMEIWQAARMQPMPGFEPQPYNELGEPAELLSLAGSLVYTILGNLHDLSAVPDKLTNWYAHLEGGLEGAPDVNACREAAPPAKPRYTRRDVLDFVQGRLRQSFERKQPLKDPGSRLYARASEIFSSLERDAGPSLPPAIAELITDLIEKVLDGALDSKLTQFFANQLAKLMPYIVDDILAIFVTDGVQTFWDTWMCGLPMDNQMDDQLWPTDFTELWIPIEKTQAVMQKLHAFYAAGGDPVKAFEHTGAFSCELYAAAPSPFWMSPSYGGAMFRVDVFWFGLNAGDPATDFYPQFWALLKEFGFRPHWGKYLPPAGDAWRAYYRATHPKLDDFLKLRAKLDPKQIFVTQYWRDNLGIAPLA